MKKEEQKFNVSNESNVIGKQIITSCPFIFKEMSEESIKEALRLSEYTLGRYKTNEKIFDSDNFKHSIAFILNGKVSVYKSNAKRKTLLSQLKTGNSFGAASLFGDTEKFPTSIYANSDCNIMFITQEKMSLLIRKFPQISINYICFLSDRIRFLNDKINSFAATSAEEKTAKFLLDNSQEDKIKTQLNMTQISSLLGIGRASLYRILSCCESLGAIERKDSTIIIKDNQKLKNILKEKEKNHD